MSGDLLWLLAAGVFLFFIMRGGGCCSGHDHSGHGQHDHEGHGGGGEPQGHTDHDHREADKSGRTDGFRATSGSSHDPVCGMTVENGGAVPTSEHRGQTFKFCSEQCCKLFDLNPGKYMAHPLNGAEGRAGK